MEMKLYLKRIKDEGPLFFLRKQASEEELLTLSRNDFVKQLELLCFDNFDAQKILAINDLLAARTARNQWSKNIIHKDSFQQLENDLTSCHLQKATMTKLLHGQSPEPEQGQKLFLSCIDYRAKLQGHDLQDTVTRGSFHELANAKSIGWHPNWRDLMND